MPKKTCIICGKSKALKENILPHGTIYCHYGCKSLLNYLLNDAIPLVWLGKADLEDREYYTSEELEAVAIETNKVYNTPKKELPLLMGKLKFRKSEKLLTQRMKEE